MVSCAPPEVINETCNSEESDVVSVPASPTAAAEVPISGSC